MDPLFSTGSLLLKTGALVSAADASDADNGANAAVAKVGASALAIATKAIVPAISLTTNAGDRSVGHKVPFDQASRLVLPATHLV